VLAPIAVKVELLPEQTGAPVTVSVVIGFTVTSAVCGLTFVQPFASVPNTE